MNSQPIEPDQGEDIFLPDPEIVALQEIVIKWLRPLDEVTRDRIVTYLYDRFGSTQ